MNPTEFLSSAKRLVVKVGTSVLTDPDRAGVVRHRVEAIASEVAALWRQKMEVIVVTSGAIGVGMGILDLKKRPKELAKLQAAAATGQGRLMQWYTTHFEKEGLHAAQILLTRDDLENHRRYLNAKATLLTLLKAQVVPIINENDTVSVEEIRYGDNDILSAQVAALVDADLLVLLSDVDQLKGPDGFQALVTEITPDLERAAGGTTKAVSTGGMRTKLEAAKIVMASGIPMILMNGRQENCLTKAFLKKEFSGTWFIPRKGSGLKGKQRWLGLTGRPKGRILVDSGAREALASRRLSLLASGVHAVEGNFRRGDLVSVAQINQDQEFARGIVGYSHAELEKIKGFKSDAIRSALGRKAQEVIHRDSMVILKS
ncbi:MAG: glutamate 5-kinase [Candidatus Omnitrophica bacterium]|nr:glutamate 5-kinase [Candidatus Omnitrophota bacterium]